MSNVIAVTSLSLRLAYANGNPTTVFTDNVLSVAQHTFKPDAHSHFMFVQPHSVVYGYANLLLNVPFNTTDDMIAAQVPLAEEMLDLLENTWGVDVKYAVKKEDFMVSFTRPKDLKTRKGFDESWLDTEIAKVIRGHYS